MKRFLTYGDGELLAIDPPEAVVIGDFTSPRGQPLSDPFSAVQAALAEPLNYPPLREATVAGDRIVIALESGLPQAGAICTGIIAELLAGHAEVEQIAILLAANEADGTNDTDETKDSHDSHQSPETQDVTAAIADLRRSLVGHLPAEIAATIEIAIHHPHDRQQLSYLAASKDNKPILVNRRLFDADLIVPVGCLRPSQSLGEIGLHGGLFPAFSDIETQRRFRAPWSSDASVHQRLRRAEADEAAWLLGVPFAVQIVPGVGDSILQFLAGEATCVATRGRQQCDAAWFHELPQRAGLVVAAISGGPSQQTWENFARSLFAASAAVTEGGTIALCTGLACRPGPSLQRLLAFDDDERTLHELGRDRSPDAVAACLLIGARQRNRLFLLSQLDAGTVEELGFGHIDSAGQIERLIRQHESCILLGDAHRAMLHAAD